MARLGNVLIVSADASFIDRLTPHLAGHDLNVTVADGRDSVLASARGDQPDLILIDFEACGADSMVLAGELSEDPVPVAIVATAFDGKDYRQALAAGVEDVFVGEIGAGLPMARLKPLLRLAVQRREMFRRRRVVEALGTDTLPPPDLTIDDDPRAILFIGKSDADRVRITEALGEAGGIVGSADLLTAGQWLSEAPFDACVLCLDSLENRAAYLNFCAHIRQNPNLYNLPIVLIGSDARDDADAYGVGVTKVLADEVSADALRYSLLTLCNRLRLRRTIRSAIEVTKVAAVMDMKTGAYATSFLSPYLDTVIEAASSRQKYLTIIALSFPSLANLRQHFGDEAGDHLMRQLAEWTGLLCRTEDVVARSGDHCLCIVLPTVPRDEARIVMRRVAGILSHTDFTVRDVYQPVAVEVEVGIAEIESGDTPDSLIERARELID